MGGRLLQQQYLRPLRQPDLFGDDERGADRRAAVPLHGLHRRASEHRLATVRHPERRGQTRAGLHGCGGADRSAEHTSELQSLMRISYAVFCLKKKKITTTRTQHTTTL